MSTWTPEAYATIAGAVVSVIAAILSIWGAQRRLRWDAAKTLGEFRADTLEILNMAYRLDNPTWRRASIVGFAAAQRKWSRSFQEHAPIMGKNAYREMLGLAELLDQAKGEVLGMGLGGLGAEEAQYDDDFDPNDMSHETSEGIRTFWKRFEADPAFLTR
jgi:hypothetical protein